MRLLKLTVTDLPTDHHAAPTRTEWINPQHIETAAPSIAWQEPHPVLWLELTLSSGTVLYQLLGPTHPTDLESVTQHAIDHLTAR